jgi:hypothetical protein
MRWLVCLGVVLAGCGTVKAPSTLPLKWIVTIHTAEAQYHSDNDRFATSLQELGPSGANMIDRDLASGEKGGYNYKLSATPAGYTISATPVQQGANSRSYFSDQGMRMHVHVGPGVATESDPTVGETRPMQ